MCPKTRISYLPFYTKFDKNMFTSYKKVTESTQNLFSVYINCRNFSSIRVAVLEISCFHPVTQGS